MAIGFTEADAKTFDSLGCVDKAGNEFAAASFEREGDWVLAVTNAPGVASPDWDTNNVVDVQAANQAFSLLEVYDASQSAVVPQAATNKIVAVIGMDGVEAVRAMGLKQKPTDEL